MAKIPETALKDIPQKCQLCGVKFKNKATLVAHIGKKHDTQVPKDWSPARYENYIRTGKDHGSCIVCKKETGWNESTWKYNRLCDNEECRKVIADRAEANCKKALGKGRKELLNDPEFQRKMIYSKKNSGKYEWSSEEGEKCENLYDSQFCLREYVYLWLCQQDDIKLYKKGIMNIHSGIKEQSVIRSEELDWCLTVARRQLEEKIENQLIFELKGRIGAGKKFFCREVSKRDSF